MLTLAEILLIIVIAVIALAANRLPAWGDRLGQSIATLVGKKPPPPPAPQPATETPAADSPLTEPSPKVDSSETRDAG